MPKMPWIRLSFFLFPSLHEKKTHKLLIWFKLTYGMGILVKFDRRSTQSLLNTFGNAHILSIAYVIGGSQEKSGGCKSCLFLHCFQCVNHLFIWEDGYVLANCYRYKIVCFGLLYIMFGINLVGLNLFYKALSINMR